MSTDFLSWWEKTGQYRCCMNDESMEEYKQLLWMAWKQGRHEALRWAAAQIVLDGNPIIARDKILQVMDNDAKNIT